MFELDRKIVTFDPYMAVKLDRLKISKLQIYEENIFNRNYNF